MPTIHLSRKALERFTGKKMSDDLVKESITSLGTGFEGIEGDVISVEVFPNRPDLLSEAGMGRALSALLDVKPGLRAYAVRKSKYKVIVDKSVSKVRPHTSCAVVTGIDFDEERIKEIIQMQEKLHVTFCRQRKKAAIGIYPLEKISWPVRYEGRKPSEIKFTPLEGSREMTATQILSTLPTGQAYGHLLEGQERYPLFVDADGRVMSMPPIINSEATGRVTSHTKDVFIECSGFDQAVLDRLLAIIVCALVDAGGTAYSVEIAYGSSKHVTPDLDSRQMKVDTDYINKRLGLSLKESEMRAALGRMGVGLQARKAIIPPYRADILHQVDIVEDVMIGIGLANIPPEYSSAATIGREDPKGVFKSRVANMLVGLGLLEANTFNIDNLINQTSRCNSKRDVVQLSNSLNLEFNSLRAWLLPSALGVLRHNRHHEYPQRLFTLGTSFSKVKTTDTGVAESEGLCCAVSHPRADYTEARQIVEYLLRMIGLQFTIEEAEESWAIKGRCASVHINGVKVGVMGEVHPEVLVKWELEMPAVALELSMDELFAQSKK